jgi:hypothetical protein
MNSDIKVRKPKPRKNFGISFLYQRHKTRFNEWQQTLLNNGDRIRITWFPDNNGVTNAYIGMEGIVENMNNIEGNFALNCGTSILICHGNFDYIRIETQ